MKVKDFFGYNSPKEFIIENEIKILLLIHIVLKKIYISINEKKKVLPQVF